MMNIWKRLIAVIVVLVAVSPVVARGAVTVYADEIPAGAVTPTAVTNPPAGETGADVPDHARRRGEGGTNPFQNMAGMLAILCTFGMPVAIIALAGYFSHRRNRMAHDTLRAMIDKGVPITPELVAEIRNKSGGSSGGGWSRGRLLPGLILAGIGTALLISGSKGDARGGWIVLFIGAAFLIVWFVEQKNQNNSQPPR